MRQVNFSLLTNVDQFSVYSSELMRGNHEVTTKLKKIYAFMFTLTYNTLTYVRVSTDMSVFS